MSSKKCLKSYVDRNVICEQDGRTRWGNTDLKLSLGSCKFSWQLESYDEKTNTAVATVHIIDDFDFNEGDGKRSSDAEKLTAIGRKAELTGYKVDVTYKLTVKVKIQNE